MRTVLPRGLDIVPGSAISKGNVTPMFRFIDLDRPSHILPTSPTVYAANAGLPVAPLDAH
jgi:hypothetical protein